MTDITTITMPRTKIEGMEALIEEQKEAIKKLLSKGTVQLVTFERELQDSFNVYLHLGNTTYTPKFKSVGHSNLVSKDEIKVLTNAKFDELEGTIKDLRDELEGTEDKHHKEVTTKLKDISKLDKTVQSLKGYQAHEVVFYKTLSATLAVVVSVISLWSVLWTL